MSKKLLKSGYVVAVMTLISRVVGMMREIVFASFFGATGSMDAFYVAFRMPNLLRRLFAEGAFSQAFVPVLSEYRQKRSKDEVKLFINHVAGNLSLALFIVTLIAVIITPILITLFAPGFLVKHSAGQFSLASTMLKITFPYLIFISLTAFAGSILNSYDVFSVPAITPVLLNFSLIGAAVFIAPHMQQPVIGLAWGVFIGGLVQLCFQIPFLKRMRLLPKPTISWRDEGVRRVMKLMLPAILGVSVAQISLLLDMLLASFLREGSITWLYFSDRLTNFPLGVFGVAIATVVLPHLSRKHASKSPHEFSASLDWALRCVLLVGLPAAIGLFILAGPLLATILQHGVFNAFDVKMARRSTMAFSLGLPAFMLIKTLATGFYSKQDIKTPVKIAIAALIANIILALALIFPLAHAGLALATSLTSTLNASLLLYFLRKKEIYIPNPGWKIYLLRLTAASIAMTIFLLITTATTSSWVIWDSWHRITHLAILVTGAALIYFSCLFIFGLRWKDFKSISL